MRAGFFLTGIIMVFCMAVAEPGYCQVIPNGQDSSTSKTLPMNSGITIDGNTITYYGRGYKIVTNGHDDKIIAVYYEGKLVDRQKIDSHAATISRVIREQKGVFEKEVETGTKQNGHRFSDTNKSGTKDNTVDPVDDPDPVDKSDVGTIYQMTDSANYIKKSKDGGKQQNNNNAFGSDEYGYKITEGNTIRYFLRGYEIVTQDGKKLTALYYQGKKIPDEKLGEYAAQAEQMINEVQENINKRVKEWFKRLENQQRQ